MAGLTQSFNTCGRNNRDAQLAMVALRQMDPGHQFTDRPGNEPMSSHDQRAQNEALQKLERSADPHIRAGVEALKACTQAPNANHPPTGQPSAYAQRMKSRGPGGM